MSAAAEWVSADGLTPWAGNPRQNDGEPVRKVAESIRRFGWGSVILAREHGEVVAGHTRLKAVEYLRTLWESLTPDERIGWHTDAVRSVETNEVPVRFGAWSEDEAHALALADNRLNEMAVWDAPLLNAVLAQLDPEDVEIAGWTGTDLDRIAGAFEDTVIDPQEEWNKGMPEFEQEDRMAYRTVKVHFKTDDDVAEFAKIIGQQLTEHTKYVWHPQAEVEPVAHLRVASDDES